MQFVKSFLKWAYDREYTNNNKFEEYGNIKTVETDSIALTKEDLDKLLSCGALNEKLEKVRNVFMFQLYTGQRYSDIQEFRITDVKNNIWTLRQQKTKKQLDVPLVEAAMALLRKYNGDLPVISNQKANKYLKELGKEAGLNDIITITKYSGAERFDKQFAKYELLTTHTARRTFVSLASNYGINQQVVKAITGHGTDKMVGKYYKVNASDSLRNLETVFNN
jgi:integrase